MALAFVTVVVLVVAMTGALEVITPSNKSQSGSALAVYEEMCSIAYGPPPVNYYLGSHCEAPSNPVSMPTTYSLVTLSQSQNGTTSTLQEAYFAVFLVSGQNATVTISSSADLVVKVFFDNRTSINTQTLANGKTAGELPIESSGGPGTYYCLPDGELQGQNEWYIFQIFGGSPGQASTATFDIQTNPPCSTPPPQG